MPTYMTPKDTWLVSTKRIRDELARAKRDRNRLREQIRAHHKASNIPDGQICRTCGSAISGKQ